MNDKEKLIAPCGMNCATCVVYFGYNMNGSKRKHECKGCLIKNKDCAFLKKDCEKLRDKSVRFCYECEDFPCENLKKLDEKYKNKYEVSLINNLRIIEKKGLKFFLKEEKKKHSCPKCNNLICIHTKKCYNCL